MLLAIIFGQKARDQIHSKNCIRSLIIFFLVDTSKEIFGRMEASESFLSCIDPAVKTLVPSPAVKVLLMDYIGLDQVLIHRILSFYPRIRDFHNNVHYLGPFIHMANFVAANSNSTLVSKVHVRANCSSNILENIPIFFNSKFGGQLESIFKSMQNLGEEHRKPFAIQRGDIFCNMAYCSEPRRQIESASPLELFATTADIFIWICLGVSLILTSVVASASIGKQCQSLFVVALSSLISPGISGVVRRRSWLLCLWMGGCIIFTTCYTGDLTSVVVSPPKEERMTRVEQLPENGYGLLFHRPSLLLVIQDLAKASGPADHGAILMPMMASAVVANSDKEVPKVMVSSGKFATISVWTGTILNLMWAKEYIKAYKVPTLKRCYLGKEGFFKQNMFMVVTRPNSNILASIVEIMMESGIYKMWYNEHIGLATSNKVQGRSRIIKPTEILEEMEPPKALELRVGKLRNAFVLWMSCLTISLIIFSSEQLINFSCQLSFKQKLVNRRLVQLINCIKCYIHDKNHIHII